MRDFLICLGAWSLHVLRFPTKIFNMFRSSRPEMFLGKSVLKICITFTGEHPWRSVISIKLPYNFIEITEITLQHGCSPVNVLHIFRTPFPKNTSGRLLVHLCSNYRSISLLPVFKKLFETSLYNRVYYFLCKLKLIIPKQLII